MAFRLRADDGPSLNEAGLLARDFTGYPDQYCYETLYSVIFQGGGGGPDPCPPSRSAHVGSLYSQTKTDFLATRLICV